MVALKIGDRISQEGTPWCLKYEHPIDYDLTHEICENLHPRGCANCEHSCYRLVQAFYRDEKPVLIRVRTTNKK